jgi:hypothetical protein
MKTCPKCQEQFQQLQVVEGKLRNLSKRKFCLKCSPFGNHNTQNLTNPNVAFEKDGKTYKKCPSCKNVLELNNKNYYIRKSQKGFHYYCKKCQDQKTHELQLRRKLEAVKYKGGACMVCGYSRYVGSLDFHHLDPKQKEFSISKYRTYNIENLKPELDKCILLCRNCHGELHGGFITL